jgi:hypothetical protein
MKRRVLVILSNRWNRSQEPRYFEILADKDGNILKETKLRAPPTKPIYDEVWENDENKDSVAAALSIKRRYPHKLEKKKEATAKAPEKPVPKAQRKKN